MVAAFNNRFNAGRTTGRNDVTSNPNGYSLYTGAQYNANYNNGYNRGVADADGRANSNSVNYQSGYNAGFSAGRSPDNGAWSIKPNDSGKHYIPAGYHNGQGFVDCNDSWWAGYHTGYNNGKYE